MKKIIFTSIISLLAFTCYSQVNSPESTIDQGYEKSQLLLEAKEQEKTAWICLGGGAALFATGLLIAPPKDPEGGFVSQGVSMLLISGTAVAIASIPLFIASGIKKHKASLLVTSQKASFISPLAVSKKITGLTLSISL